MAKAYRAHTRDGGWDTAPPSLLDSWLRVSISLDWATVEGVLEVRPEDLAEPLDPFRSRGLAEAVRCRPARSWSAAPPASVAVSGAEMSLAGT